MAQWDGSPYVTGALWDCWCLVTEDTEVQHLLETLVFVRPRMNPIDPYDMVVDFSPVEPITFTFPEPVTITSWNLYRQADFRWLHGGRLDTQVKADKLTMVMPNYDRPWRHKHVT